MGERVKFPDGRIEWCATTPADGLATGCGGLRTLLCECGGDLCVCGNDGEVECLGCADCEDDGLDGQDIGDWSDA